MGKVHLRRGTKGTIVKFKKAIPSNITFYTRKGAHEGKVMACVRVGNKARGTAKDRLVLSACEYGKNPRTALAKAFRVVATKVSKRSGAFAGLKRR